jgi:hypothetical protein
MLTYFEISSSVTLAQAKYIFNHKWSNDQLHMNIKLKHSTQYILREITKIEIIELLYPLFHRKQRGQAIITN